MLNFNTPPYRSVVAGLFATNLFDRKLPILLFQYV